MTSSAAPAATQEAAAPHNLLADQHGAPQPDASPVQRVRRDRLRLSREAELPRVLRALRGQDQPGDAPDSDAPDSESGPSDLRRPTPLAGAREEQRQIRAITHMVCQAVVEALAGIRPVQQMHRWLEPAIYQKVSARAEIIAHSPRQVRASMSSISQPLDFRTVRAQHIRTGVWEVSAVFDDAHRTRACALRFQAHRGRWRATALELG